MSFEEICTRLGGLRSAIGKKLGNEIVPMSEVEINDIESLIRCRLPEYYRSVLPILGGATFDGGPDDSLTLVFSSATPLPPYISEIGTDVFSGFYGSVNQGNGGFSLLERIQYWLGRLPDSLIPIGDDFGAGLVCIGIRDCYVGKIYYWDQRNEPLDEEDYLADYGAPRPPEAMYQNVHLIADSFEEFLNRLQFEKI